MLCTAKMKCLYCNKDKKLNKCGGCKKAVYCSVKCQK